LVAPTQNQKQGRNQSTFKKNVKRKQTNSAKGTIQHNNKENNYKQKKPRKIKKTKNRLSSQNYKNTNSQTKKDKAIRNQITTKKITQITPKKKIKKRK
jgi:hypothetical protein